MQQGISRIAVGATVALTVFGAGTATSASALTKPTEVDEITVIDTDFGKALADEDGNALYVFEKDEPNKSECTDEKCAKAWPAALASDESDDSDGSGDADDPDDLTDLDRDSDITADFGTIAAKQPGTSGKEQLTVDDQPLYFYDQDTESGDTKGHGLAPGGEGTTWYLVGVDGKPLPTTEAGTGY